MAKVIKYDTIEEVVAATGVELTEKTRAFLESFVKKVVGESAGAKKKELLAEAELFGVQGLDPENENVTTLQIKVLTHLFTEGRADEMKDFADKHNLYVTENGEIHRVKQAVKKIEDRNAGVKEGSVGFNTIQLLKEEDFAGLTASELALKQQEVFGQQTTAACVQWYINFCHKKKAAALETGNEALVEQYTIADRKKAIKTKAAGEPGVVLGAELTLEKALAPRGFQKKKTAGALGAELPLDDADNGVTVAAVAGDGTIKENVE